MSTRPTGITVAFGGGTDDDTVWSVFGKLSGWVFDVYEGDAPVRTGILDSIDVDESDSGDVRLVFNTWSEESWDGTGEVFSVSAYDEAVTLEVC